MNYSAFGTRNSSALSDAVVGTIMQRSAWQTRDNPSTSVDDVRGNSLIAANSYHQRSRRHTSRHAHCQQPYQKYTVENRMKTTDASMGAVLSPSIAELIGQSGSSSRRKRISCLLSDLKTVNSISENIKGANSFLTPELQHAIVADALKKKIRHRERCRINQARYRQRQLQVETDIEDAIHKLKSEIKQLDNKTYNETRQPTAPTSWALASDYFRQLNYYVSSPEKLYKSAFKFIHEFMAPDVEDSSSFEADEWLKNWRLSATYFEDVHVEVKGMKTPTPDTLIAGTTTSMTITSNTLRLVFPHLNIDGVGGTKGGAWSPLASKLLGKRLVMSGSVIFHWDSLTGKATSIQSRADMITPMLKLLGSLEDVSNAFYKARVTPDGNFTRC